MHSLKRPQRGLTALAGALVLLCACAEQPAAQTAAKAAPTSAPPPATASAPAKTTGAVGKPPAGFEALEVATPTGRTRFFVEIADNDAEREKGLMFRTELAPDRGMLFDFHTPREVAFWMHNTLIPLDIIYIQPNGVVLSIARNATPKSDTPIPSGGPVSGVLELAGGRAAEIGLMPGDRIEHRIFKGD